jgi:hypothetical protein
MNKLSKIVLLYSISILSTVIVVNQTVLAQEDNAVISQETPNREIDENMEMERTATPSGIRESAVMQRKNTENLVPKTRDRNIDISDMNQRVNSKNNRLAKPDTITTEEREQKIKERCETINAKIVTHKEKFALKSQNRLNRYNKLISRLEVISQKLSEKEIDVTEYNKYIAELVSKVDSLNLVIQNYIQNSQLESASICSNQKPSDFISTKKESLQVIITQDKALRSYVKDTIIPLLRSIKPQEDATTSDSPANTSTNADQVLPQ